MRTRLVLGGLAALVAVTIAGISFAAIPGADGTISGCYKKATKVLRVVNAEAGQTCRSDERPISWNQEGPPGPSGSPGVPGDPGTPGLITDVAVASSDEHEAVGSTDWTNLTDATVSVDVADGAEGLLIVRFSALSRCNGALDGACLIRLLVDGEQMDPAFEEDSAVNRPYFDLVDPGQPDNPEGEAHTIERSIEGLGSGTHVVKVQYRNPASICGCSFEFFGWHLTAEVASTPVP